MSPTGPNLRIDKWLWHARFFKTRTLAAKVVGAGGVRLNGVHVKKPSVTVRVGDTLTFPQARDIRVARVLALGERRGPAPEAALLYEDLTPAKPVEPTSPGRSGRHPGTESAGRPTKKTRRALDAFRRGDI